ncbi:MAG: glycosyl hydrolase, partial [Puia sp.]
MIRKYAITTIFLCLIFSATAQIGSVNLDTGWKCKNAGKTKSTGEQISRPDYALGDWLPATVPGTVLTTLINNKLMPDPFYGMNNEQIPDIFTTGAGYYTYWFVTDFKTTPAIVDQQTWLHFRGVNYSCDIYLNG